MKNTLIDKGEDKQKEGINVFDEKDNKYFVGGKSSGILG